MAGRVPQDKLREFAANSLIFTTPELCEMYGKAATTISEWRSHAREEGCEVGYGLRNKGAQSLEPLYYVPAYDKWADLEGDAVVIGDCHIPYCDWSLINKIVPVAERMGIKRLIIAGDLLDLASLTGFPKEARYLEWEKELQEVEHFIEGMLGYFDEVLDTVGNHLRNRLLRRLEGELSVDRFKRLFTADDRVVVSPYPYMKLRTKQGAYHITHQRNYSINSLTVAKKLCHKHRSHIITHHQHRMAMGFDESGTYFLIDNGSMAEEKRMAWYQYRDSTTPAATHGFVAIRNGYPYLFGPHTDWAFWLGESAKL